MRNKSIDNAVAWLLVVASAFVALFLSTSSNVDPVNVPKMLVMAPFAYAAMALTLSQWRVLLTREVRWVTIFTGLFFLAMIASLISSNAPMSQLLFGTFGRNTGLLTYLSLLFMFFSTALVRTEDFPRKLIKSLMFVGIVNVFYGVLQLTNNDPLPWNNTYHTILGTFGNPDFVSAFLGITVVVSLALLSTKSAGWKQRCAYLAYIVLTLFEIKKSHAIQGFAVTVIGFAVVGFFLVRSRFKSMWATISYSALVGVVGFVALLGALQKGPLAHVIYKVSISLRGEYWAAAINTTKSHPLFGVGMDSFGDWYRRERRPSAIGLPGVNTVVNTAHNVFLDMAANGGLFLLISYVLILSLGAIAIVRAVRRTRDFDATFVAIVASWIAYQAQSVISINQIGVAIWGWVLTGALISYEINIRSKISPVQSPQPSRSKGRAKVASQSMPASSVLLASAAGIIGLMVCLPAFVADSHMFTALNSQKIEVLQKAALAWPKDSQRLNSAAQTLIQNSFNEPALVLVREAVKFNPDNFDSWNLIYGISLQTPIPESEKAEALMRMKELDPLNPNLKNLK